MKPQTELVKKYAQAFTKLAEKLDSESFHVAVEFTRNKHAASVKFALYRMPECDHAVVFWVNDFGDFQKLECSIEQFPTEEFATEDEFITRVNRTIRILFGNGAPRLEVQP